MPDSAPSRSPLWPGVPFALASAVLFGASAPFAKLLLGSTDPQLLAGLLYIGAGIGLADRARRVGRLLGIGASEAPLRRADVPWLIAIVDFRRRHRAAVPDARARPNFRRVGFAVVESRRTGDHGRLRGSSFGRTSIGGFCSARHRSWRERSCYPGKGKGYVSTQAGC